MSKLPSMPFFPADFFADTAHMSGEAAAIYLVLLGHAWLRGGALPNDHGILARLARVSGQRWTVLKKEILPFFEFGDDGQMRQKRLVRDYENVLTRTRVNSENGIKGNYKRWGKNLNENNKSGIATANGLRSHARALPEPELELDKKESTLSENGSDRALLEFEKFWKEYGHKLQRKSAEKAYRKALGITSPEAILSAVAAYHRTRPEWQQIALAASWLNGERWNDQPLVPNGNGHVAGKTRPTPPTAPPGETPEQARDRWRKWCEENP